MKITKQQLKQIIREEISKILTEGGYAGHLDRQKSMGEPDIDTGEDYMSPEEIRDEEVQDLADKFNVEAFVEIASDGKPSIIVKHQDGKVSMYNDTEEMYKELADEIGQDIHGSHDWYGDESPYDAGY